MNNYETVLIVDDDPTQLVILQAYFLSLGAQHIYEASSAGLALQNLDQHGDSIDLIVSDLVMPNMDGIEFLRSLKNIGFSGDVALISSLEHKLIDSARKLGEFHKLSILGTCRKPLNKQKLDELFLKKNTARPLEGQTNAQTISLIEIEKALENNEFIPFYQPKVEVRTGRITGVESLVRWRHPIKGIVPPALFLPRIESLGLTNKITFLMCEQAMTDMAHWTQQGIQTKVAINVAASDVADLDFPNRIHALVKKHHIDPKRLVIEVTENEVLEFNDTSLEVLARLRLLGIDVAIDDFGTGYSNLKTLKEFPYTELKIDQAFIRGMTTDSFSQETVRVAATLGRQLNMRLLAEGVETVDEWNFVRARGIDEVQGFLIAKPMSADDFYDFYLETGGTVSIASFGKDENNTLPRYAFQ